jgi:hypothetical protein
MDAVVELWSFVQCSEASSRGLSDRSTVNR